MAGWIYSGSNGEISIRLGHPVGRCFSNVDRIYRHRTCVYCRWALQEDVATQPALRRLLKSVDKAGVASPVPCAASFDIQVGRYSRKTVHGQSRSDQGCYRTRAHPVSVEWGVASGQGTYFSANLTSTLGWVKWCICNGLASYSVTTWRTHARS